MDKVVVVVSKKVGFLPQDFWSYNFGEQLQKNGKVEWA